MPDRICARFAAIAAFVFARDLRPVRRDAGEAVLDRAVVEARLPGSGNCRLDAAQVVRAPVVGRGGQPLLRRELLRVGVVPDPGDPRLLGEDAGRGAVDVLAEHVGAGGGEGLRGGGLLRRREPRVRPDDPHLGAGVRRLRAEREGVQVPHDLGDAVGHHVADDALLGRRARGHAGEVDRVLASAEVLGLVRLDLQAGRLLEQDLRVLRVELAVDAELEHPERRPDDHVVTVADEAGDDLRDGRVAEDVLLVGRLHLVAERLLDVQASGVVRLRPPAVVVRPG